MSQTPMIASGLRRGARHGRELQRPRAWLARRERTLLRGALVLLLMLALLHWRS
jgi:hypothetical protein